MFLSACLSLISLQQLPAFPPQRVSIASNFATGCDDGVGQSPRLLVAQDALVRLLQTPRQAGTHSARLEWNTEATIGVKFGIGPVSPGEQPPVTALGNCFNCPLPSICELGKRSAIFENLSCDPPQPFVRANVKTKAHSEFSLQHFNSASFRLSTPLFRHRQSLGS